MRLSFFFFYSFRLQSQTREIFDQKKKEEKKICPQQCFIYQLSSAISLITNILRPYDMICCCSSLLNDNNEANRTSHAGKDISGCSERIGGWRSTRNRSRTLDPLLSDSTEHLPRMINGAGNFVNQHGNRVEGEGNFVSFADNLNSTQTASTLVSEPGQMTGQRREGKKVIKREKKRGLNMGNDGECSTLDNGDSDILFLGSSETPESSKSSRIQRPQFQGMLRSVIEVDELSPAAGPSAPQGINSMNDDSEARARQLESDEMLARELQEQLYHEVPAFGGGEVSAFYWTLFVGVWTGDILIHLFH